MRVISLLLALLLILLSFSPLLAASEQRVIEFWADRQEMAVDGQLESIDVSPQVKNEILFIPLRFLVEGLEGAVQWQNEAREVLIAFGDWQASIQIDRTTSSVNGEDKTLKFAPYISESRTMISSEDLPTLLGLEVVEEGRSVKIYSLRSPYVFQPLYLAILWHMHQPLYYQDPQSGLYMKPWVRLHATKDYLDMVQMVEEYPQLQVTFNLTPTLIKQLDDLSAGAQDYPQYLSRKKVSDLTLEEKSYILSRFFDANWQKVIPVFPRYEELLLKRGQDPSEEAIQKALSLFSEQDFLDLQVLFNLAWMDPDFRAQEPLAKLVAKGRNFTEEEKNSLLDFQLEIIKKVLPEYRRLQEKGQIEITMTPYSHPILPLIYDSNLAKIAMPQADLPSRFSYPLDAVAQVAKGVSYYEDHFGQKPIGMWPAEGAVAQEIVNIVYNQGIKWMASDEEVLAKSLGLDSFARDGQDLVQLPELLYSPYRLYHGDNEVSIIFRDHTLSDLVGFRYSGTPGEEAASDFINRLHAIGDSLKKREPFQPHLVSVILDGENAWEYYTNDGKEFLHNLYQKLTTDSQIKTITPASYLNQFPEMPSIKPLWAGSWISHDFSTWIGEEEENRAWECLLRTRQDVETAIENGLDEEKKEQAMEKIYAAEGSDWFWWYGSDQDSGDDASFDLAFRGYLADIYKLLGKDPPDFVYVPILTQPIAKPERDISGFISPQIDGVIGDQWEQAGLYLNEKAGEIFQSLLYGLDQENIYLAIELGLPLSKIGKDFSLEVYLSLPGLDFSTPFSRFGSQGKERDYLGFYATHELFLDFSALSPQATLSVFSPQGWSSQGQQVEVALKGEVLELKLPLKALTDSLPGEESISLQTGDEIKMRLVASQGEKDLGNFPSSAFHLILPETGSTKQVLLVEDPLDDDHGPGNYVYPTDPVFSPGCFDLKEFSVLEDEKNVIFKVQMAHEITNPWNSPIGLSLQAIDIYIHQSESDQPSATMLLPGRNARLSPEEGWHYAIWVEGWTQGIYRADNQGKPQELDQEMKVIVDARKGVVTIRVAKDVLGDDPSSWGFLCTICSQDGFPSPGVWRVREVKTNAEQWRIGGGIEGWSDPGILDLARPQGLSPTQEELLSQYRPSEESNLSLIPEEFFALIPLIFP